MLKDNFICEVLLKIYESNIDIFNKIQQMDENTYNKLKEIESLIKQIKDKKDDE